MLLKSKESQDLAHIGECLLHAQLDFIDEVVACEQEIYIKVNSKFEMEAFKTIDFSKLYKNPSPRKFEIPFLENEKFEWTYISKQCGLTKNEYIEAFTKKEYSIAMFGFLPGFVYINGLENKLHLPRKQNPDLRVKENSLAVGGKYIGIYSLSSPGGWHVIGHLLFPIVDFNCDLFFHLKSSDKILFKFITKKDGQKLLNDHNNILSYNGFS